VRRPADAEKDKGKVKPKAHSREADRPRAAVGARSLFVARASRAGYSRCGRRGVISLGGNLKYIALNRGPLPSGVVGNT
jgi:hypothetical protein